MTTPLQDLRKAYNRVTGESRFEDADTTTMVPVSEWIQDAVKAHLIDDEAMAALYDMAHAVFRTTLAVRGFGGYEDDEPMDEEEMKQQFEFVTTDLAYAMFSLGVQYERERQKD